MLDKFLQAITLLELIYSTTGIYKLLLTCIVGMTLATNFDLDGISLFGRTTNKAGTTSTYNCNIMVIRLDILVHIITSPAKFFTQ